MQKKKAIHWLVTREAVLDICNFACRLETLKTELANEGHNVEMFIINGGVGGSPDNINNLVSRVSFPVYQDDSSEQIWNQVFRGRKDDILIFDRYDDNK